jgi:3-oxoadipate enol-lactonase
MQRWLSDTFRHSHPADTATLRSVLLQTDPVAYTHACAAVAGIQLQHSTLRITCPTLVVAGLQDQATPVAMSEALTAQIAGAQLATIDAAHLSAVEQPDRFAALVDGFVRSVGG